MAKKPTYEELEQKVRELEGKVAKRKHAEEELRESELRYRKLFDNSPVGIGVGTADGRALAANDYLLRMTGYRETELNEIRLRELYHNNDDRDVFLKKLEANGFVREFETEFRRKDGKLFYGSITVTPFPMKNVDAHLMVMADVTRRKEAENALRESEELSKATLNATTDMVYLTDTKGNILTVNDAAARNLGKTPDELISTNIFSFFPPDKAKSRKEQGDKVTRSGKPLRFRDDREGRVFDVSIYPTSDAEGKVDRLAVFVAEITERKQAEEALHQREATLKSIFRAAPIGIGLVSNRVLKHVNDRICKMTGYSREELVEQSARILYPTNEDFEYVGSEKYAQIAQRGTGTVETRWKRKDGKLMDVLLSSTPVDPDNLSAGVTFTALDITERKKAENQLRESKQKYRSLVETTSDWVWEVDQDGVYVYASPKVKDLLGYEPNEVVGKTLFDFMPPDEAERMTELFWDIVRTREPLERLENTNIHKNGHRAVLETSGVPILDEIGNLSGYRGIDRDITVRKQAEEALSAKEAELRNKAKNLEEVNTALRVLLKERKKDKTDIEEKILSNVKDLVLPYIDKIKKTSLDNFQMSCIDILKSNLEEIVSPFARKLSSRFLGLTPTEIRVADLVKEGKTTKEIAEFMNLSPRTVEFHRDNVREKLGIKKSNTNLRTYLLSM
jgi:PAS domain S-box-containing protein